MATTKALVVVLALAVMFQLSMGGFLMGDVTVAHSELGWYRYGVPVKGRLSPIGSVLTVAAGESVTVLIGDRDQESNQLKEVSEADFSTCTIKALGTYRLSGRFYSRTPTSRYFIIGKRCIPGWILTIIWK